MTLDDEEDLYGADEEIAAIQVTWQQEMWVLDPGPFIDLCFDQGVDAFVFRAKFHESFTQRQDWTKFIRARARGRVWRAIWTPYPGDFAVLFDSQHGYDKPQAVWPIWRANQNSWRDLDLLIENPWSDDPSMIRGAYGIDSRSMAEPVRASADQQHRILVANFPKDASQWGRFVSEILRLASQPDAPIFHFHGQKSVARCIGMRVPAFDHPVRIGWYSGQPRILLPNGQMTLLDDLDVDKAMWLKLVGMAPRDFNMLDRQELSRRVYDFNLRSLKWAYLNYDKAWDFRRKGRASEAGGSEEFVPTPTRVKFIRSKRLRDQETEYDKWLCDTCIYQDTCPYSREGAVCILPGTDGEELANRFKTRNGQSIVEALGVLMSFQAKRLLQAAAKEEEAFDEKGLDDAVTRLANSIFDRGVQLAKLVDPAIAGRLVPKVNIGNFNLTGGGMTPQALMSGLAQQLKEQGVSLEDMTEDQLGVVLAELVEHTGDEDADADAGSPDDD